MRPSKFDKVKVAEITVSFTDVSPTFTAKAAFVSTKTGQTHGWTTGRHWSKETQAKLRELRELMERDLEETHFEGAATERAVAAPIGGEPFRGIGEHLSAPEGGHVPQG